MRKLSIYLSPLLIALILFIRISENKELSILPFYLVLLIVNFIMLVELFKLTKKIDYISPIKLITIRSHILMQIVPLIFILISDFSLIFLDEVYYINLFLFVVFFLTGRKTWIEIKKITGDNMYSLFTKGNTAILIPLTVFNVLSFLFDSLFWSQKTILILAVYSYIHLCLLGPISMKLKKQL